MVGAGSHGEGNGNPLQCSCLENPRDGGSWWAAVSGVAQSHTQLKRLSSSSSSRYSQVQIQVKIAQSFLTLRDPMDCSLPGSSIHVIFQARVLEWGAIAFSQLGARYSEYWSQKILFLPSENLLHTDIKLIYQSCNILSMYSYALLKKTRHS